MLPDSGRGILAEMFKLLPGEFTVFFGKEKFSGSLVDGGQLSTEFGI